MRLHELTGLFAGLAALAAGVALLLLSRWLRGRSEAGVADTLESGGGVLVGVGATVAIGSVPGIIAGRRGAAARVTISILGYVGAVLWLVPWVIALIWACVGERDSLFRWAGGKKPQRRVDSARPPAS